MGTRLGWKAGMPTPPLQHILKRTKSQHCIGESQSHMFSQVPGLSLPSGDFFLRFFERSAFLAFAGGSAATSVPEKIYCSSTRDFILKTYTYLFSIFRRSFFFWSSAISPLIYDFRMCTSMIV